MPEALDVEVLMTAWMHRDPGHEAINTAVLQCLAHAVEALGGGSSQQLVGAWGQKGDISNLSALLWLLACHASLAHLSCSAEDLTALLHTHSMSPSLAGTAFMTLQRVGDVA